MINAVINKVPNWIIEVGYTETGGFDPKLMSEVLKRAVLTSRKPQGECGVEKVLRAVVSTCTHPMHLYHGATWRHAEGEIFEDDRFGPNSVEEFTIQPILGVARAWCTGLQGESSKLVREEMRERVYSLLFEEACRKAGTRGMSTRFRHRLADMLRQMCTLLDPFQLEDHQVDRIVGRVVEAVLEQADVPTVALPWSPNELNEGKLYGLSIPLLNPERDLWLDFRVAADELIKTWPDMAEEVSKLVVSLQMRLLGSPLPLLPSGLRFGGDIEDFERALWKDLLDLRDLCDQVSSAGEDAEYLLDELRKTVHQIIALRRYRYTPKWDVLHSFFEAMPIDGKKKYGILSKLSSPGVGKAIEKASAGTGIFAFDWSVKMMNAIYDDSIWVILESESIQGLLSRHLQSVSSPVLVILYDLEWEWLAQSGETDMSQFHIQQVSIPENSIEVPQPLPNFPEPPVSLVRPLTLVEPPASSTHRNGTQNQKYCIHLSNRKTLCLGERQHVWVRPRRGAIQSRMVRDLLPRDFVIRKDAEKIQRIYWKIQEALRPEHIQQFQQDLCERMKELGLTNREVWRRMINSHCEIENESEISLWRTGRTWGPRRVEDLEKLAEILDSAWLREHWREVAGIIEIQDEQLKYQRITDNFLKKSAQHSPHWNEVEKDLLKKAGLELDDLRECLEFTGVVSVESESLATAA